MKKDQDNKKEQQIARARGASRSYLYRAWIKTDLCPGLASSLSSLSRRTEAQCLPLAAKSASPVPGRAGEGRTIFGMAGHMHDLLASPPGGIERECTGGVSPRWPFSASLYLIRRQKGAKIWLLYSACHPPKIEGGGGGRKEGELAPVA